MSSRIIACGYRPRRACRPVKVAMHSAETECVFLVWICELLSVGYWFSSSRKNFNGCCFSSFLDRYLNALHGERLLLFYHGWNQKANPVSGYWFEQEKLVEHAAEIEENEPKSYLYTACMCTKKLVLLHSEVGNFKWSVAVGSGTKWNRKCFCFVEKHESISVSRLLFRLQKLTTCSLLMRRTRSEKAILVLACSCKMEPKLQVVCVCLFYSLKL